MPSRPLESPTFPLETDRGPSTATWRSESDAPPPSTLKRADDRLPAKEAMRSVERGESLLWQGDFHNARQLLTAMARQLGKTQPAGPSPLEAFRAERAQKQREQEVLARVVVALDEHYTLSNRRAPDVALACEQVWGPAPTPWTVVPVRALAGMMGAAEWRKKGLVVPGLKGPLYPHYGVFSPTRHEYVSLLLAAPAPVGKTIFDVGCGTGILGLVMLQRGAASVLATDVDPRAVACAQDNAQRLGLADRMKVLEQNLFPEGKADLILCNPPWVPEQPKTRMDRAVFDDQGQMLASFLSELPRHLKDQGEAYLLLSNLAELVGLRPKGFLNDAFVAAGLRLRWKRSTPPLHAKAKDRSDRLHAIRKEEVTSLYCLTLS